MIFEKILQHGCSCPRLPHERDRLGRPGQEISPRHQEVFYLCEWLHAVVAKMPGLHGELSSKELHVIMAVAKNNSIARVGRFSLPLGQGAKNGAKTFLKVPLKAGRASAVYYKDHLAKLCPKLEKTVGKLYPQLPAKLKKVDIFDVEPALCGAFIYAKQAA